MKKKQLHIVFITPWYPNRVDDMLGLFVQRHAEAIAAYANVHVLSMIPHPEAKNKVEIEVKNGVLNEYICYYRPSKYRLGKMNRFFFAALKAYKIIEKDYGKPDLCHVNILTRCGIFALYLKIRYHIPYLITEHWSRYFPINADSYNGKLRKMATKKAISSSEAITSVSHYLANQMIDKHGLQHPKMPYQIISNVVDTTIFKKAATYAKNEFISISCFEDKSKNLSGLLRVIKKLEETGKDFKCILVGDGEDFEKIVAYSKTLGINEKHLEFTKTMYQKELSKRLAESLCLLQFSNYENQPVTISEALCCGVTVIASDVGGISEHINKSNGFLIEKGDEDALLEKMIFMLDHADHFQREKIIDAAIHSFDKKEVGLQFFQLYQQVLNASYD